MNVRTESMQRIAASLASSCGVEFSRSHWTTFAKVSEGKDATSQSRMKLTRSKQVRLSTLGPSLSMYCKEKSGGSGLRKFV